MRACKQKAHTVHSWPLRSSSWSEHCRDQEHGRADVRSSADIPPTSREHQVRRSLQDLVLQQSDGNRWLKAAKKEATRENTKARTPLIPQDIQKPGRLTFDAETGHRLGGSLITPAPGSPNTWCPPSAKSTSNVACTTGPNQKQQHTEHPIVTRPCDSPELLEPQVGPIF